MSEFLLTAFACLVLIIGFIFVYVSSVIIEEEKRGKRIPLFWEPGFWDNIAEKSWQKKANKIHKKGHKDNN